LRNFKAEIFKTKNLQIVSRAYGKTREGVLYQLFLKASGYRISGFAIVLSLRTVRSGTDVYWLVLVPVEKIAIFAYLG